MTTRWLKFAPAGLVLLLAALLRIADPGVIADLRLAVFDTFLRAAPRTPNPQYPVRIVTIDEASLKAFGQWPWPRTVLADIIDKLNDAGAKTISLDIILPEADRLSPKALAQRVPKTSDFENLRAAITKLPNSDEVLASSLKKSTAVVGFSGDPTSTGVLADAKAGIASAGDDPEPFLPRFPAAISSLSIFNEVATGLGAVNWLPQRDQLVRRVPMLVSIGGKIYPTLSAEAFRVHKGDSTVFVKSSGSSGATAFGQKTGIEQLRIGDTVLPVNREGELWLYLTKPDPKRYISAQHVLSDSFDASTVEGRDIFIGASAAGLLDLRATPLSTSVPGVEIHAQALEQMRAGTHLVRPAYATGYELLFLLAVGAAIAAMIVYVGPTLAAIAGLALGENP